MTKYHQGKPGVQIRIDSLSKDGSHSSVTTSNGLNTFVRDVTVKTRSLGNDENDSASTGQLVAQESRNVERPGRRTDQPTVKAQAKLTSSLLSCRLRRAFEFMKEFGLVLDLKGTRRKMLRVFIF